MSFGQRLPFDQLHRQEDDAVLLLDGIDRDDVGMVQRGHGTCLTLEPIASLGIAGERVRKHFQSDSATQLRVVGQKTSPIPPAPMGRTMR